MAQVSVFVLDDSESPTLFRNESAVIAREFVEIRSLLVSEFLELNVPVRRSKPFLRVLRAVDTALRAVDVDCLIRLSDAWNPDETARMQECFASMSRRASAREAMHHICVICEAAALRMVESIGKTA